MATKLLIPLLNRNVTLFKGPTWYLSDQISIEAISHEDYGLIFTEVSDEYKSLLSPKSKCIRVEGFEKNQYHDIARSEGAKIAFLLNYFKRSYPVALSFAVQITKRRKSHLDLVIDLPVVSDARLQRAYNYRIRENVPRESISDFYRVISIVHEKYPGILVTLDRFNSALFRVGPYDKIIDITISLESLISGTTELRHKFALYNTLKSEADENSRAACYKLLTSLYDARSAIVHGAAMTEKEHDKKIRPLLDNWDLVIEVTEKALSYHILYLYVNDIQGWYNHQVNLALVIEERII